MRTRLSSGRNGRLTLVGRVLDHIDSVANIAPGYAKAEYAVGYFKEIGIGCRQDALEANVWYVRAAQQGEERAKQRLAIIQDAASGGSGTAAGAAMRKEDGEKKKKGLFGKLGK